MPEIAGVGTFTNEQWATVAADHAAYATTVQGLGDDVVAEIAAEAENPVHAWSLLYMGLLGSPSARSMTRLRGMLAMALLALHDAEQELKCWRLAFGDTALKDATDRLRAALDKERIEPEAFRLESLGEWPPL